MLSDALLAQATIDAFARKELLQARVLLGLVVLMGLVFLPLNVSEWIGPLTAGVGVLVAFGSAEWLKAWRRYRTSFDALSARCELPRGTRLRPYAYFRQ